MIVSLHVATGGLAGSLAGSRGLAVPFGLFAHALGDRMPHDELRSRRFEAATGIAALLLLAAARGPLDPAVVGAAAGAAPDVEHVIRLPRPGGRKLFPSHRVYGWHRSGGVPIAVQLVTAGWILGALAGRGLRTGSTGASAGSPRRGRRRGRRSR